MSADDLQSLTVHVLRGWNRSEKMIFEATALARMLTEGERLPDAAGVSPEEGAREREVARMWATVGFLNGLRAASTLTFADPANEPIPALIRALDEALHKGCGEGTDDQRRRARIAHGLLHDLAASLNPEIPEEPANG